MTRSPAPAPRSAPLAAAPAWIAGLTPAQQQAVLHPGRVLVVVAGAGSGKTRVLTTRIARRVHDASASAGHVLALTFTRKAAGEMRTRLAALGVRGPLAAGTFHAVALAQMRTRWADLGRRAPGIRATKAKALARIGFEGGDGRALAQEIEWAKARRIDPAHYAEAAGAAGRTPTVGLAGAAWGYAAYEDDRREHHVLDFDDLLSCLADEMEEDPSFAAAQRWRFRHLFVDELQDMNPLQQRLLATWLGPDDGADRGADICLVGDPRQAIYGWNGADLAVSGQWMGHPEATVIVLDRNLRSSPEIVAVGRAALGARAAGHWDAAAPAPAAAGGTGPAERPHGPPVTVAGFDDEAAEAAGIVAALRAYRAPGVRWRHMAVLARTNAQVDALAIALEAAGIPVQRPLTTALASVPACSGSVAWLARLPADRPLASTLPDLDPLDAELVGPDAAAATRLIARLASELLALDPAATVGDFLADWLQAPVGRAGHLGDTDLADLAAATDAVTVTTFHRAKGLEWPVVCVAGAEDGYVPMAGATSPDQRDEERRLFYVACTRAEWALHVSWARSRERGGRIVSRAPSPWLADVRAAAAPPAAPSADARGQLLLEVRQSIAPPPGGRPNGVRGSLHADPAEVAARHQRLLRWRSAAALASRRAPSAVCPDRTLRAIAESGPTTLEALAAEPSIGVAWCRRWGESLLAAIVEPGAGAA